MSAVLVLNAGSSTLKYALYSEDLQCLVRGLEEGADHAQMLERVLPALEAHDLVAAGHRVVHGGDLYAGPVRVTPEVIERLEALAPLAPLHQPHNLAAIRALAAHRPGLAQVACFDTAFHQSEPDLARRFALPAALHEAGVKRYGFHGLSYEYLAHAIAADPRLSGKERVIAAHLGNGSSLCAMRGGRSVASTMGFTALDGLVMGTRCGALDPGVLLYLMDTRGMSSRDIARLLYRESGLLGVSGLSHDMRVLLASDDPRARLAVDLYCYRAAREIGSLAAALGGLDLLVFTAGIGEHAAPVRAAICERSRWLGVELDPQRNARGAGILSRDGSAVTVAVVPTNEEEMIARHTLALCGAGRSVSGPGA
ncbi:MAG: acetate/propionate family kinase [Burkholderiales bacterium]|nr:acetate/propionate family kinase [Burkholderiales bacterium]